MNVCMLKRLRLYQGNPGNYQKLFYKERVNCEHCSFLIGEIEYLTHSCLGGPLELGVVWIQDSFDKNFGIKNDFLKILEGELIVGNFLITISPSNILPATSSTEWYHPNRQAALAPVSIYRLNGGFTTLIANRFLWNTLTFGTFNTHNGRLSPCLPPRPPCTPT